MKKMINKCKAPGCNDVHYGKGYCKRHYKQFFNNGYILERTRFMTNEIIQDEENKVAYIILYNKEQRENARCIIDLEDVEKIKDYRWSFRRKAVANCPYDGKETRLISLLINDSNGKRIYYKNNNPLDCRKDNLTFDKSQTLKNGYNLKCCPYCGSEEYYIKQKFKGNCNYVKRFDGEEADNTNLYENAICTNISNYAFCKKCNKKLFELENN